MAMEDTETTVSVSLSESEIQWLRARVADNLVVHPEESALGSFLGGLNQKLKEAERELDS